MTRLPPEPALEWRPDGTPVSARHDDIYYAAGDGLAEARAVFLEGCGLPEAWSGRRRFTVAETGFGTGLNFLATWAAWRAARPDPGAWLSFVSFEAFPLSADQAGRALDAALVKDPDVAALAARLLAAWPERARGVRHLVWPDEGVRLMLHVDPIADSLPRAEFEADAWFLDGFSPARNAEMWAPSLFPAIAARTAPGGRVATFSVAGPVRRGLVEAGFDVDKMPGYGRKRERLEARLARPARRDADPLGLRPAPVAPRRIAVIGAGIAGCLVANRLSVRGGAVTLYDRGNAPGTGASGNPLALLMPRLDAADTVQARLLVDAYLSARAAYAGRPGATPTSVEQRPRDAQDRQRFEKILADPPLPSEDLRALPDGGLRHDGALILRPPLLLPDLIADVETCFGEETVIDLVDLRVNGRRYDAIVLAAGPALSAWAPWAMLEGRLGQVEHARTGRNLPAQAVASGTYALADGCDRLWGATYGPAGSGPPQPSDQARAANAEGLAVLAPDWCGEVGSAAHRSRAAVRATTPDRLPLVGALPDGEAYLRIFAPLRKGQPVAADAPLVPGVWLVGGLGSRGFTFAPWLADLLVAQMFADPVPASVPARTAVSPVRMLRRRLRRG